MHAMMSGEYYLNLHIVTGRKPLQARAGDLLPDGTRQPMVDPSLAPLPVAKSTQWERFAKYDLPFDPSWIIY
jgi:hypothetical protein